MNLIGFGLTFIVGNAMSLAELIISKKLSNADLGFVSDVTVFQEVDFRRLQNAVIVFVFIFLVISFLVTALYDAFLPQYKILGSDQKVN